MSVASAWARRQAARRVGASAPARGGRPRRAALGRGGAGRGRGRASRRPRERADLLDAARVAAGVPVQGPRLASTSPTPGTSSGASGSSPSWSRGPSARRCSGSSDRRAAASPPSCGPACCLRWPAASCRASSAWPQVRDPSWRASDARAAQLAVSRCAAPTRSCWRSTSSRRSSPRAATRPSARRSSTRSSRRPRERRRARRARSSGRLLCALCRISVAGGGCSAPTTCSSGRWGARSCAARSSGPHNAPVSSSNPSSWMRSSRTSRTNRGPCRCCPPRCSSCGSGATGVTSCLRRTSAPAACAERWRGWRRRRSASSTLRNRPSREWCCCASPERAAAARSFAGASPLAELEGASGDDVGRVLALLTDRRLLTMSATTVEVAHEALLREWPRLRDWLEEDADGRRVHRHLADAAREWDERGRAPGDLYGGARLAAALEWRDGHEHELNATERAFLDASRTAAGRAQRRLRLALAGVAALLVVAALGGVVALHQRGTARSEARAAEAQRLGAQALIEQRLDRSLLLARQGVAPGRFACHPQQPARRPAAQPGRRRRHWWRPGSADRPRSLSGRPDARDGGRSGPRGLPRPGHPAAARAALHGTQRRSSR